MAVNKPARLVVGAVMLVLLLTYALAPRSPSAASRLEVPGLAISRNKQVLEESYDPADKAIVVASQSDKDTSWIQEELPDWKPYIYQTDSRIAPLHVERNKGNEANVYLSFILAHYDRLPATMVFVHHHRWAYHVDNMFADNAAAIRALKLDYVQRRGYASLRCMDEPGCICAPMRHWDLREEYFKAAWPVLFPDARLPSLVQAPCCAQFAVSRAQVRARPLSDYRRMHAWLMGTELRTAVSGRIMEHLWHIVFGQDAVLCEDERRCYCDKFGRCPGPAAAPTDPLLNDNGTRAGFWPDEYDWLDGHKCAKFAGWQADPDAAAAEQKVSDKLKSWAEKVAAA